MTTFLKNVSDTLYKNSPSKEDMTKVAITGAVIYTTVLLYHHSTSIKNYIYDSWNYYKDTSQEINGSLTEDGELTTDDGINTIKKDCCNISNNGSLDCQSICPVSLNNTVPDKDQIIVTDNNNDSSKDIIYNNNDNDNDNNNDNDSDNDSDENRDDDNGQKEAVL